MSCLTHRGIGRDICSGQYRMWIREKIYFEEGQRRGFVPCFVCGREVLRADATLEHIIPLSKGGTDERFNLTISHEDCNKQRGDA